MTTQYPHPCRCETCEFDPLKKGLSFESCPLWDQIPYGHDELFRDERIKLLGRFRVTTKYTGCAPHSSAPSTGNLLRPVNASEQLPPCPKCGSPTFCGNIDGGYQILCMNDACKWKQEIVAEPVEQRIKDVIAELKRKEVEADQSGYTDWPQSALIRCMNYEEIIELLRGEKDDRK